MDQIAKGQNVVFKKNGSQPEIQIVIGSVAIGLYSIFLWRGMDSTEIGRGGSDDDPPKRFKIGNPATLSGCKVSWNIGIAGGTPTDPFTQTVIVKQNGNTLATFAYPPGKGDDLTVDYLSLVGE